VVRAYEVVLATCNGEQFLDRQIASILAQTVLPKRLLVADDASIDGTVGLLQAWQRRSSVPLELLPPATPQRLGSCRSFERLLLASQATYVMPADQDDLWDSDKAERLLTAMAELEQSFGRDIPLLVHGDLRLIDACDRPQAPSFYRHQGLHPQQASLFSIALQNVVTGCACLVNRACLQAALPFPPEAVLHDWWLALVAARLGRITYQSQPCISYRQHGGNAVGAAGEFRQLVLRVEQAVNTPLCDESAERWIGPALRQWRACAERFAQAPPAPGLSPAVLCRQSQCLPRLWSRAWPVRLQGAAALGLRKHGLWRTLGFYAALLCWRPQ
jgi:hypothetical protein